MKNRVLFSLVVLFSPLMLTNSKCSKECGFALCDLITDVVLEGTLTVVAGTPFGVPNLIKNIPETIDSCQGDILETLSAKPSQSRLKIDFDLDGNGSSFELNVKDSRFDIGEIPAGMSALEKYLFSFDDPGVYQLITFADDTDVNKERNEENNASAPENLSSGRLNAPVKPPLIIKVLPNPDFQWKEGEPRVRVLSRTVTIQ